MILRSDEMEAKHFAISPELHALWQCYYAEESTGYPRGQDGSASGNGQLLHLWSFKALGKVFVIL